MLTGQRRLQPPVCNLLIKLKSSQQEKLLKNRFRKINQPVKVCFFLCEMAEWIKNLCLLNILFRDVRGEVGVATISLTGGNGRGFALIDWERAWLCSLIGKGQEVPVRRLLLQLPGTRSVCEKKERLQRSEDGSLRIPQVFSCSLLLQSRNHFNI